VRPSRTQGERNEVKSEKTGGKKRGTRPNQKERKEVIFLSQSVDRERGRKKIAKKQQHTNEKMERPVRRPVTQKGKKKKKKKKGRQLAPREPCKGKTWALHLSGDERESHPKSPTRKPVINRGCKGKRGKPKKRS